jgi:hypothetical protein
MTSSRERSLNQTQGEPVKNHATAAMMFETNELSAELNSLRYIAVDMEETRAPSTTATHTHTAGEHPISRVPFQPARLWVGFAP